MKKISTKNINEQITTATNNANCSWQLIVTLSHQEKVAIEEKMPHPRSEIEAYRDRNTYAKVLVRCMSTKHKNLIQLFRYNQEYCQLIVRGLPFDPAPENTYVESPSIKEVSLTVAIQVGIHAILGLSPISYPFENRGKIFRWVSPTLQNMASLSSHGATRPLEFHSDHHMLDIPGVEHNQGSCMPETLSLAQLYHQLDVPTYFISYEALLNAIPEGKRESYFKPIWHARTPESVNSLPDRKHVPLMVIHGGHVYGRLNAECTEPSDEESSGALRLLLETIENFDLTHPVTLAHGDLTIWKNARLLHGRAGFQPRLDGTDRAALRMFASSEANIHPVHPEVGFLDRVQVSR